MSAVGVLQDTTGSSGVTVIPEDEPTAKKWIKEHPAVIAIIAVSVLLILIIPMVFYFVRRKRLASSSKEVTINDSEAQVTPPAEQNTNEPQEEIFADSFMIIGSPNLHNHRKKRKSTLAVPPAFSVSSNSHHRRKSAPSVQWGRWSTAGLEIHSNPPPAPEALANPMSKAYARKKRQSTPGILMAVPVVYRNRRTSPAQTHNPSRRQSHQPTSRPLTP